MKRLSQLTALGVIGAVATSAFAPLAARADRSDVQNNKNLMRNLAIGAAALGGYGLLNHDSTLGLLGAAGAAVAGTQYEKDRKQQSQDNTRRDWYYNNRGGDRDYETYGNGGDHGRQNDSYNYRHQNSSDRSYSDRSSGTPDGRANGWNRHNDRSGN